MRVILLGTGTPILDINRQATMANLIEIGAEKVLFDVGRGVTTQLLKQGIDPTEVDTIFITHHHYDHICDLGEFLLNSWHNGRTRTIHVIGPHGTSQIVDALLNQIYARDIAFALFLEKDRTDIRQIVQVTDVTPGLVYKHEHYHVFAAYVDHGNNLGLSVDEWPCLGYRLEANGKIITIGGDTIPCSGLECLAKGADILILSCYLATNEINTPAFMKLTSHVIASSGEVGKIAQQAGAKKLVLTHFRKKSAELMQSLKEDVQADFEGEIYIGEDGMRIKI